MFTNNWFEITAKVNFEKYVGLPNPEGEPRHFLEVGCYEGQASVWMLENTVARLTVVDTFVGGEDLPDEKDLLKRFTENIEPFEDRIIVRQGTSQDVLKKLTENVYDFIYIDGSHLAKNVLEDAILAFPLLKEGGTMIFDDYTWGQGMNFYDIPKTGIDAFLLVYGNQLDILEKNSQCIIRKKAMPPA
jgi:predicted O-methyltransferase YrrM